MHETKIEMKLEEEMKPLKKICETLEEAVKHEFEKGIESVNVEEMGEVIDMLKDIYEAKEKLIKGCYYKQIIVAMEKAEEEDKEDEKAFVKMMKEQYGMEDEDEARRFYRGQPRSRTSGRFMSHGDGRRSNGGRRGYEEMMPMDYRMEIEDYKMYPAEYMRDLDRMAGRMYYSGGGSSGGNSGGSGGQSGMSGGSSGGNSGGNTRGYEEYQRGYSEGRAEGYNQGRSDGRNSQSRDYREGRSGTSRRGYMESRENHRDNTPESKQANMKELEKYMKSLSEDLTEAIEGASNEEKTMLKSKLQTLVQKIQ